MPKYTYTCSSCGASEQKLVGSSKVLELPCAACSGTMARGLPKLSGKANITEVVDSHTGVRWGEDHVKSMDDRKRTYFWEVEVPRMVNSGTYSIETMLENRWVYINDKGELVTRTRPPETE